MTINLKPGESSRKIKSFRIISILITTPFNKSEAKPSINLLFLIRVFPLKTSMLSNKATIRVLFSLISLPMDLSHVISISASWEESTATFTPDASSYWELKNIKNSLKEQLILKILDALLLHNCITDPMSRVF